MSIPEDTPVQQLVLLDGVVSSLASVEASIQGLQAVKAGLLSVASQIADDIAESGSHPDHGELAHRSIAAEIGAALRISDRSVQRQMGDAVELVRAYPAVHAALAEGSIGLGHVRVIVEAGETLESASDRAGYEQTVLAAARTETPSRLRVIARRAAERFQDRGLQDRHDQAAADRRVWVRELGDGMSEFGAILPTVLARGAYDRLSRMAHTVLTESVHAGADDIAVDGAAVTPATDDRATDARTVDQRRADLFAELLLTGTPHAHDTPEGVLAAITAQVEITVPVLTLINTTPINPDGTGIPGRRPEPAELAGSGPIDPATARILAAAASGWDRVLTDPIDGQVLAVDRYRPGERLRRLLRARDRTCRWPGCGIRAERCDLDHTEDAAGGGATSACNLAHLCRRHHILKHHSGWRIRQTGRGSLEFTSPLGRVYRTHPPGRDTPHYDVAFTTAPSDSADAPF